MKGTLAFFYGPIVVAKLQSNTQPLKLALLSHFVANVCNKLQVYRITCLPAAGTSIFPLLAIYVVGLCLEF